MALKNTTFALLGSLALAAVGSTAQAGLILDTAVTGAFLPHASTTNTVGNDLPAPLPSTLYFGQIRASTSGYVDFFYIGNEASYTNSFKWGNGNSFSTTGQSDTFNPPNMQIGSLAVSAGELLDFGFCTDGGNNVLGSRCVWNDSALSIVSQYNYGLVGGYRSIGYAALDSFDPATGDRSFTTPAGDHDDVFAFFDDSGARNDDNHDDMIVGMKFRETFRPDTATAVSEPGSLGLVALGLMGLALVARRSTVTVRRR